MFTWIFIREAAVKLLFCFVVLCLNLTGIYFIYNLYSYDVVVRYLSNGGKQTATVQLSLAVLFLIMLCNLLFASFFLMKRFLKV
jgi:membrane-anchored protein YejM (alkaline phosphatase superfamily)